MCSDDWVKDYKELKRFKLHFAQAEETCSIYNNATPLESAHDPTRHDFRTKQGSHFSCGCYYSYRSLMRQIRGLTSSDNDSAYCTLHTHFTSNRPFRRSAMFTVGGLPGVRRTRTGTMMYTLCSRMACTRRLLPRVASRSFTCDALS
ncbi:hypothetical protein CC77DRAFT_539720 [Alternaria alternata]|uniref:Uncharacterized protein n=1 Tax=Alternaria alternata TaxID=5599 RepID=A0A177DZT0_ALTAL|nr:hypothetical protein CC77DRAFT_539720 [Alternaria alternata]OAG24670.1 hypothetical protein CC77DRAFT_539720 [Alternaria alternata]